MRAAKFSDSERTAGLLKYHCGNIHKQSDCCHYGRRYKLRLQHAVRCVSTINLTLLCERYRLTLSMFGACTEDQSDIPAQRVSIQYS